MIELEEIADVKRQLITPSTSRTIIGLVQDGLLGAYNLTAPTVRIDWKNAMNIMSYTALDDFSKIKKGKDYTGHQLFSLIIPPAINTRRGDLKISGGILESGRLTKDMLGSKKKNALHQLIWDEYGAEETRKFIDDSQRLVNNFNLYRGFTVGYGDVAIKPEVTKQIEDMLETLDQKVNHMITDVENNPDLMDKEVFEFKLFSELNIVRDNVSKLIMESLDPENNFSIMITSGSKGSAENMGQIAGLVGMQAFEGAPIPMIYNNRTLAYFHKNDDRSESRGLVKQSFVKGLEFPCFVFHQLTGREGIIDQAIKSVVGDTAIIILENGISQQVKIGDWIDQHLKEDQTNIKRYKNKDQELLDLKHEVYIPTTNEDGQVSWGIITAITRHDPTDAMYEIKTSGGRSVIVTDSKSLLIFDKDSNKFEMRSTPDVKVGDFVPATMNLPIPPIITQLDDGAIKDLNEFFKNAGIENNSLVIHCPDNTLNYASMLCARFGIYTEINDNTLTVKDQWLDKLRSYITLSNSKEDKQLKELKLSHNEDIQILNDVVLDKIIYMEKVDVSKYPKVYDLTVPSTLNFGLANGLHVVDTAETGYAQRRLVKSMEDVMVKYDGTVRTANDTMLQPIYGDSGADTTKQYEYTIKIIEMNNSELMNKHKFTPEELKSSKDYTSAVNDKTYNMIKDMRDDLRRIMIRAKCNFITLTTLFMLPVNLSRIIDNNVGNKKLSGGNKLSAQYVLDKLEEILLNKHTMLMCMTEVDRNNKKSVKNKDEQIAKTVFRIALFDALSPKRCCIEYGLSDKQFDNMITEITKDFNKNIVQPGEMIGLIGAQAMGEP